MTFSLLALLALSPNAIAQGSASGDTYKDPFSNNGSQTPGKTAQASKSTSKNESSGSGLALVLVLVGVVLLAAAALTIRQRRRSRDGPNG